MNEFVHTRHTVRQLQQAHADYIEAMYTGLSQIPGNPRGVMIRTFGETRTFLQRRPNFSNRVILIGNEPYDLLDKIILHFRENTTACHIEINPSNFSQSQHPFWEHVMIPHLTARGFQASEMRCVWIYNHNKNTGAKRRDQSIQIDQFSVDEIDRFYPLKLKVTGELANEAEKAILRHSQSVGAWTNYIAFLDGSAAATATLFIKGEIGYLVWGFTNERYRRRGCHTALIQKRIEDASDAGCSTIFTVSDIDAKSVSTLQSCGFVIAYNYIMMESTLQPKQ